MRTAIITGAGRGIGAATAYELGGRGWHVIVDYRRDAESAAAVVERIRAAGGSAEAVRADVRDPGAAARLVAAPDRVDALVCNANTPPPFAPLAELSWDDVQAKVSGELAAAFHVTRHALARMRERRAGARDTGHPGRVVYVSSVSADQVRPGTAAHATAKAALNAFARHVAAEAGPWGITVNTIAPGAVRTDATAALRTPAMEDALARASVLGRMLEPDDIAPVVASLLDGAFDAVSGTHLTIDGGRGVLSG